MQTNQEATKEAAKEAANVLERRIDMSVAMAEIEKDVESRLKKLSRTLKMPGFRPGKVPLNVVARTYAPQARSEAIGAAVEKAFGEAVRAQNLRVAGYPRIEPKETSTADALEFSAVFEVYPDVVVGDLSGRGIARPVLEVGDAEIDKTLVVLRKQRVFYEPVERAAAAGDRVTVDFAGRKNGELFEGGQGQDFPFVIGAGTMLETFDVAVTGMTTGENKTFDLTFPADYDGKHLAGQTVQFEVTVKKVEMPVLPEIDADFAKALGVADGDVVKLREEVKVNLAREVKRRIQARVKDQVMETLLAVAPIEAPRTLVTAEAGQLAENARRDFESHGLSSRAIPVETAWFVEQAARRVKLGLIMAELVKANDLHAQPGQVRALIEEMAESYEDSTELVRWYYAQPERLARVEAIVTEDNVVEWVCARVNVINKAVSFDELMSHAAQREDGQADQAA
jgi:trigger factor